MSLTKYESTVKIIPHDCDVVYSRLADLNNLSKVQAYFKEPANRETFAAQIPADKIKQIEDTLDKMTFDTDSVKISAPMVGEIGLKIIEREAPKLIKFESQGAPVSANLWIQLLPAGEHSSKIKITLGASLNFFIKGMADKYAPTAVERMADILASLPYNKI